MFDLKGDPEMTVKELENLYGYGYWANRKLFDVIAQLSPEEFTQIVAGSYESITPRHLVTSRNTVCQGLPNTPLSLSGPSPKSLWIKRPAVSGHPVGNVARRLLMNG